jgi:hypothetical protein
MFFFASIFSKIQNRKPTICEFFRQKMLKRGGSFGADDHGVTKFAKTVTTFQSVLVDTRLAETVLARFCTTRDLAALVTCQGVRVPMTYVLTPRKVWNLDDTKHLSPKQLSLVRKLRVLTEPVDFLDFTGLVHLDLDNKFEHPLPVLPSGLTHLVFGCDFNQPLKTGVLPSGLQHLTLGHDFDWHIETGVLPSGLQHLTIGTTFDCPIEKGVLPVGLRSLKFDYNRNRFECVVPAGLQELECSFCTIVYRIPAGCVVRYKRYN